MRKIMMIVVLLMGIIINNSVIASGGFADVKEGDWYYGGVGRLIEKGIVAGFPDGTFKPSSSVQADQFIKMVLVGLGNTDIQNGTEYWASNYISKAKELNILTLEDFMIYHGNYNYTRAITREEMAIIISRALTGTEANVINNIEDQKAYATLIKEYSLILETSKSPIAEVYAKGILMGYPDGYFKPYKGLTRAEATTVILRLIDVSERAQVTKPTKTIDDVEDEESVALPKNAADFYRINPEVPTYLYEYAYNQKAKYDMDYFMTNKEVYNDLNYSSSYGGTGRQLLGKIKKYATEYLDAVYNMDYTKDSTVIRDAIRYHFNDVYGNEKFVDDYVKTMKDNKVISKYEFLTDDSLVYQDSTGGVRIRGKLKIMYLSNNGGKCVTFDNTTNDLYNIPIELNKWYEQDVEFRFSNAFGQSLWTRTEFVLGAEYSIK
ncbi:MAG TPA: hypothetical protein DEP72_04620 [Clostridiales bacterium]|nr:MAG: hypothetical protein A2Y18_05415 [Clostridiales bacterium GWD2_32_19]HCC07426.1 hypothetical protein [Clostridiales bacterium]